jgi:hypothetical protein
MLLFLSPLKISVSVYGLLSVRIVAVGFEISLKVFCGRLVGHTEKHWILRLLLVAVSNDHVSSELAKERGRAPLR